MRWFKLIALAAATISFAGIAQAEENSLQQNDNNPQQEESVLSPGARVVANDSEKNDFYILGRGQADPVAKKKVDEAKSKDNNIPPVVVIQTPDEHPASPLDKNQISPAAMHSETLRDPNKVALLAHVNTKPVTAQPKLVARNSPVVTTIKEPVAKVHKVHHVKHQRVVQKKSVKHSSKQVALRHRHKSHRHVAIHKIQQRKTTHHYVHLKRQSTPHHRVAVIAKNTKKTNFKSVQHIHD